MSESALAATLAAATHPTGSLPLASMELKEHAGVHAAALEAAKSLGVTEGRTAERARAKAILTAPDAKGREAMAMHLAFSSDMAADAAIDLLKVSPVQTSNAGGSRLDQLMQDPKVAANVVPPLDPADQASAGLATAVDQFIATMR